jgi:hypothetical protein
MSDNSQGGGNQVGSAKRGFVIIAVFVIIIIALVAVIAFLLGRNTGGSDNSSETSSNPSNREVVDDSRIILDEKTAQSTIDEMRKEVKEGMFECSMSTKWTFADGNAESKDAYVANSKNNTRPFYFDVKLKDTNEVIYSSPVIPVGGKLTNFKLDKPLSAGTYKAVCMYSLLKDEESQEVTSSAGFVVTIEVLN